MAASWDNVLFEEIDGKRRKIILKGSEAPHGHFRGESAIKGMGRETRRSRHEEPGSHIPAIHVTGTKLKDLVIKVHFRDSLTGVKNNALGKVQLIDDIQKESRMLRLVWGSLIYQALLIDFDLEAEAQGEFTATMRFERYDFQAQPRYIKKPLALSTSVPSIDDALGAVQTSLSIPGINLDFSTQLEQLFSALTSPLAALLSFAEDIESGITDTLDGLKQIANQAAALKRRLGDIASYLGAADDPTEDAASAAAWTRARADALVNLQKLTADIRKLGLTAEEKAQGRSSGRTYVIRDGDTLERIAIQFNTTVQRLSELNPSLTGGPLVAGVTIKLP